MRHVYEWWEMRHGYEWWEAFWKWLLAQAREVVYITGEDEKVPYDVETWLREKMKEFEDSWRG